MVVLVRRCLPGIIAILLSPAFCVAQRYTFKEYVDGLENLNPNCMLQDRMGFLWTGTENGLFRYDGSRFQGYGHAQGLTNTFITALHQDASGRLWVGTNNGLFYLENGHFTAVQYNGHNISIKMGSTLSSLQNGIVLAATEFGPLQIVSRDHGRSWRC